MLSTGQVAGLLSVSVMLAAGQLLFKRAARDLAVGEAFPALLASMISVPMAIALVIYGFSTALWVYLLHSIPLSKAYPFVALAFALVPCASWLVFGEQLGARYFVGLALMVASLYVITTT